MNLVMTLMVRDEADIIEAMLEHHFRQGVSRVIVTDNGSADGTWEILKRLSQRYPLDIRQDPVQRKQQSQVVTRMARDAHNLYSADWVLNADADEFWLPQDRTRTLAEIFAEIDPELQSFTVPVRDMTGPPAIRGTGLQRIMFRDTRVSDELRSIGLLAPSTHDCAHIGSPDVEVTQGNHMVNLKSFGSPPHNLMPEVLHFPWRSWIQFARKVSNAGRAYQANPQLQPSPNHHGMRDFRRYEAGELFPHYVARCLNASESDTALRERLIFDSVIADTLTSPVKDRGLPLQDWSTLRELGHVLIALEHTQASINEGHEIEFQSSQQRALNLRRVKLIARLSRRARKLLRTNPF